MRRFTIALALIAPLVGITVFSGSAAAEVTSVFDISCANVLCPAGTICIDTKNGPRCIDPPPPPPPK